MNLFRLCVEQLQIGQPLPWDVYNEQSQLLLHRGYELQSSSQLAALIERGMYVDQGEFDDEALDRARTAQRREPAALWMDMQSRMTRLLTQPLSCPDLPKAMKEATDDVQFALTHHRDEVLYESLIRDSPQDYAVSHAMQTAFVAHLIAERMGWKGADLQRLTEASLTMNLGMTELQSQLAIQLTPLSSDQRQAVAQHGRQGRHKLEQAGISDVAWLNAVEHHHVTPDGGPLPAHHGKLGELACLMHYTDVYLAKISARSSRPAMPSHLATRAFFVKGGGAANPYVSALIKELGVYPPGCCVRLANGETGVVVRRGEVAHQPEVCSLLDAKGESLAEPVSRNTAQDRFKIVDAMPRGKLSSRLPNRQRLNQAMAA
jgi:HD-GYP domain-containing protein (c-di-GMP phosphodiesterase class II)